jgi:hypothetical protein
MQSRCWSARVKAWLACGSVARHAIVKHTIVKHTTAMPELNVKLRMEDRPTRIFAPKPADHAAVRQAVRPPGIKHDRTDD